MGGEERFNAPGSQGQHLLNPLPGEGRRLGRPLQLHQLAPVGHYHVEVHLDAEGPGGEEVSLLVNDNQHHQHGDKGDDGCFHGGGYPTGYGVVYEVMVVNQGLRQLSCRFQL